MQRTVRYCSTSVGLVSSFTNYSPLCPLWSDLNLSDPKSVSMSLSESLSVFICFCRFYQLFVKQTCRPRYWNLFWMKSRCFPLSDIQTSVCTWLPVWTPRIELLLLNSSHADLYGKSWEQLIYLRCVCSICQRHFSDAFLERILCDGDRSLDFIFVLLAIDLFSACYAVNFLLL